MMKVSALDFICNIESYLEYQLKYRNAQPSGVKAKKTDLNVFSMFINEKALTSISGPEMLEFTAYLTAVRGNLPASANRKISTIKSYMSYLYFRQIEGAEQLPYGNTLKVNCPYPGQLETLTVDEVQRLLESTDRHSANGFRDFVIYSLLYRLGLRIGEVNSLDLRSINFEKEVITIQGKGRRTRILPLVSDMPELLREWISVRNRRYKGKGDSLFLSQKGNRLSIRAIQENFKKLVAKAGPFSIEKVTPHTLRHAFATHYIEGGVDNKDNLVVLKAVMGHARLTSTEIYLHPSMILLKKSVNNHLSNDLLADITAGTSNIVILRQHQINKKEDIHKDEAG